MLYTKSGKRFSLNYQINIDFFAKTFYGIPIPEMHFAQNKDEQFVFKMNSPKAEVLWFYMRKDDKFQPEDGKTPSEDDMKFVRAFRNTLAILT